MDTDHRKSSWAARAVLFALACVVALGTALPTQAAPRQTARARAAGGPYFRLVPVAPQGANAAPYPDGTIIDEASGTISFAGTGPQRVWFEVRFGGWGTSQTLKGWQFSTANLSTSTGGLLRPADEPCTPGGAGDDFCRMEFGDAPQTLPDDKSPTQVSGCNSVDNECFEAFPLLVDGALRSDFLHLDTAYGCNTTSDSLSCLELAGPTGCRADDGNEKYAATLVVETTAAVSIPTDVPVGLNPSSGATFFFMCDDSALTAAVSGAVITFRAGFCSGDGECNDNDPCTTDVCGTSMMCENTPIPNCPAVSSAITYQGSLENPPGTPVDDTCDFEFALCDDPAAACAPGTVSQHADVEVVNGVFTVPDVDFGPGAFPGDPRWLEISVQCSNDTGVTTLAPRVEMSAAPYSHRAYEGVGPPNSIEVDPLTGYVGVGTDAPGEQLDVAGNVHASGAIASGNSITIDGTAYTVTSDASLDLHVSAGRALRLETTASTPNVIGGYGGNTVDAAVVGATIGGGGRPTDLNRVGTSFGTIGGGVKNTSTGDIATVSGGSANTASGYISTIGGGGANNASGFYSSVCGGELNTAGDSWATVGGGISNIASGESSTVPGGGFNLAAGDYSLAAGRGAEANFSGQFVWADSVPQPFPASGEANFTPGADQFLARSTGGAVFASAVGGTGKSTAGVQLASGGGSWSSLSDKASKDSFASIDPHDVLGRLAAVPITTWNYKSQDASIRHIGPMAQDFHAAFGVGENEKFITTIDADGVALAAIQGLYEMLQEKDCELDEFTERNASEVKELREQKDREIGELRRQAGQEVQELRSEMADLKSQISDFESQISSLKSRVSSADELQGRLARLETLLNTLASGENP